MNAEVIAKITTSQVQDFIFNCEEEDETRLLLKYQTMADLPFVLIAQQIAGRRKAKEKLPTFYKTKNIFYPPTLNIEQCTSEAVARFKAAYIKSLLPTQNFMVDLTGGFGVDAFFFSQVFDRAIYVEPNQDLLSIAQHNHLQLEAKNIQYSNESAEQFLLNQQKPTDLFYIDPSRRKKGGKVFKLEECEPSITQLQESLFTNSDFVLVKASPLLDIQQGLRELKHVEIVLVVSVKNECKELLFLQNNQFTGEPLIKAINLNLDGSIEHDFSFYLSDEKKLESEAGELKTYLYEANASILKAGAFKKVAQGFGLAKMDVHTHLYSSSELVSNFPGRIFCIKSINPSKRELTELLPDGKANVITRNYPLSPEGLKKKLKLKDGGNKFIIGFAQGRQKTIVIATRVK